MRRVGKILTGLLLAVSVIFAITACGNGGTSMNTSTNASTGNSGGQASTATTPTSVIVGETTPTPPPSPTTQQGSGGMSGIWNGQWANQTPDTATGTFSIQWSQQGSNLTGNISIVGTPCLSGGGITGTINGSAINFGVVEGQVTVNYAGIITGSNTMSGTYSTSCGNAYGDWQATKQ